MLLADQLAEVIAEAVATPEFRELVHRIAMAKYGPKLAEIPDEAAKETVVDNGATGLVANYTPHGLAWNFRNMLAVARRPPNSQETLDACEAAMADLIAAGIPGQRILNIMRERKNGERREPLWEFVKRVRQATPVRNQEDVVKRAMETQRAIKEREG